MPILTNKDIETLVEVEELLHKKLVETNANDKENDIWTKYWNLVERVIINKKNRVDIVNQRNKTIYKERHKLNNAISYFRTKKNKTEKDIKRLNALLEQRNEMNKSKDKK